MGDSGKKRAIVAITGASGIIYGLRLIKMLLAQNCGLFCIISRAAEEILPAETDGAQNALQALENICTKDEAQKLKSVKFFEEDDFYAPCASGSFMFDAMAIAPCSMKTLGKIASGVGDNLIIRAAAVALKDRRRRVVVPRETPLALTHLRNMCTVSEAGGVILPACPAFYQKPESVDALADFVCARAVSAMGFKQDFLKEWNYEEVL